MISTEATDQPTSPHFFCLGDRIRNDRGRYGVIVDIDSLRAHVRWADGGTAKLDQLDTSVIVLERLPEPLETCSPATELQHLLQTLQSLLDEEVSLAEKIHYVQGRIVRIREMAGITPADRAQLVLTNVSTG